MKKPMIVAFVFFLLLSSFFNISDSRASRIGANNELIFSYDFDDLNLKTVSFDEKSFNRIHMPGDSISYTSIPGEPRIPVKGCKLVIPFREKVESIHVSKNDLVTYKLNLDIEPSQRPYPEDYSEEINFDQPDEVIYTSDEIYPNIDYEIISTQICRGYTILFLSLYPVEYIPSIKQVNLYKNIKVSVITSTDSNLVNDNYRGLQKDIDKFVNYDNAPKGFNLKKLLKDAAIGGSYDSLRSFHYKSLFVGSMWFQDPFNLNVDRLERCVIHYTTLEGIVPFCAYNGLGVGEKIRDKYSMTIEEWEKKTGRKMKDDLRKDVPLT